MSRSFFHTNRGQSLAEFAIVLPVLLILVLGSIDLGRLFFAYISITNAARIGAQYASTSPNASTDVTGIRDAAVADTNGLTDTSSTNPDVSIATGADGQGHMYAEVTVDYTYSTLFPWPVIPASVSVERTVRAMVGE